MKKGFTIVELLIVIVVIGILAAITIVAFNGVQNRAHNASAQSDARTYANVIQQWATLRDGRYPTTYAQFNADIRTKVNRSSLETASAGNVLYCTNSAADQYIVAMRSKSGSMFVKGSNISVDTYTGTEWWSGGTVVCAALGMSNVGYWNWGYQPEGWGEPGWRNWVQS